MTPTRKAVFIALAVLLAGHLAASDVNAAEWIGRLRVIHVSPNVSSDEIPSTGSRLAIDAATMLEVDVTAMITPRLGLELIATVTEHDVSAAGGALDGLEAGSVTVIAPTLSLQYRLSSGRVQPYVGAGIHYTAFLSTDPSSALAQIGVADFDLDNTFGPAVNGGLDIGLGERWLANIDVKYLWIPTTVSLNNGTGTVLAEVELDADPWVFGIGVGCRF